MKIKKIRYLSSRVGWMFLISFAFLLVFLTAFTVNAVREGEHVVFVVCGYTALGAMAYVFYRWIYQPYLESAKVLRLFLTGYTIDALFDQKVLLSPEIEEITKKVEQIMNTDELVNATKKQAQYLALQNQINPHFLYNTLEGIRGETLNAGLENVSKMTEALATFFRYTISNVENLVTLEEELTNVNNYYIIQRYRFGERLSLNVEYDPESEAEIMSCKLPKLTLQPIVENAIYHGIERKIGNGNVHVKIETTANRLIITISDNGIGMTEERLREIDDKLSRTILDYIKPDSEAHGGIAVVNVNNRIKLLFGEEYGICMYSTLNVGTDVEITLPLKKDTGKQNEE
ncbi:sensor histidine kinase [Caproiciproducens faecalis]|uniref:Histidine kinase n=1 Tax=Caproiciproducens faecalis TaxID=2820301 RepID=A0ABS7DLI9_9FIRM|nr:histidine kinase [Caproiciproducens faecalis]MBW7572145.1 histidine kinase [Caproiciproducens faecalis]